MEVRYGYLWAVAVIESKGTRPGPDNSTLAKVQRTSTARKVPEIRPTVECLGAGTLARSETAAPLYSLN